MEYARLAAHKAKTETACRISNQLQSFHPPFASEDKDIPMLDSGSLADPATSILREQRAGNPDVDMLMQGRLVQASR